MVENERTRTWAARLVAPLAFLAAAIILIMLVESGLNSDEPNTGTSATPTTTEQTGATNTTATQRRRYRVKRGDTLESIAERFGTTVETLIELNPDIDPLALSPGQRIRVS
jgi:LysM repeat protein